LAHGLRVSPSSEKKTAFGWASVFGLREREGSCLHCTKAIASCTPQFLSAPHPSYNISQLPLQKIEKVKLVQLYFPATAVADVGGGREGCPATF